MKTILVDAWNGFVTENGVNLEMRKLLDSFPNKKIILTNATQEQKVKFGILDMPYEVFSLEHNPDKTDGGYYEKMLDFFGLDKSDVVCFEHNKDSVEKAKDAGVNTFWYDKDKKDLVALEEFLRKEVTDCKIEDIEMNKNSDNLKSKYKNSLKSGLSNLKI